MSFPTKRPVLDGDTTTHGGIVRATGRFKVNGCRVAVLNDTVHCPQCGTATITEGDATLRAGFGVALHGFRTSCGATLISSVSV
ncbi:PAAR domain-containing protein [Dyella terrae]|uniref:PAAR domain-containing protein n=1 Tax=Dyella terrae TaxID=522259 RepID=UPI001EFC6B41|nr:PAAR domain-containing protein [Dyella terrae]ULU24699.1 PAAR domain-containing protein [Dyella terrae]